MLGFISTATNQAERRRHPRIEPPGLMIVTQFGSMRNIPNADVVNISRGGAALRAAEPVNAGERLSFSTGNQRPPVHCEVIACEQVDDGQFLIRCKCLLGGFDL